VYRCCWSTDGAGVRASAPMASMECASVERVRLCAFASIDPAFVRSMAGPTACTTPATSKGEAAAGGSARFCATALVASLSVLLVLLWIVL